MSIERVSPEGVASPTGPYSHVAVTPSGVSLVWFAGQVGRRPDGSMPEGAEAQTAAAFDNLEALFVLLELSLSDVVLFRTYLVGRSTITGFGRAREARFAEWFGVSPSPPNTLLFVQGLADPRALVEIETVVARDV